MTRIVHLSLVIVLLAPALFAAPPSADADKVWLLEKAYWQYVQAKDLQKYRTLWHTNFLGWPSVSPEPLRKDHITDWITARTSKGESLKSYDLERLITQLTGNLATVTYRVRLTWADKSGADQSSTVRIIHTWVRNAGSNWQIISGMSAPTDAAGH
jgi:ketosteroid isomerase-like protein